MVVHSGPAQIFEVKYPLQLVQQLALRIRRPCNADHPVLIVLVAPHGGRVAQYLQLGVHKAEEVASGSISSSDARLRGTYSSFESTVDPERPRSYRPGTCPPHVRPMFHIFDQAGVTTAVRE